MMAMITEAGCIGIERAPVEVRELTIPCTRKPNRECCGHTLCTDHYQAHKAGVHSAPSKPRRNHP